MRGEGCYLFDEEGKRYLDCYNNVASVGHCHPQVVSGVSSQLEQVNTHTRYLHPKIVQLSERLKETLPASLHQFYYTCSGSEANDLAYRLAISRTGGMGVICSQYAYHGGTYATSAFTPCYVLAMGQTVPSFVETVTFQAIAQPSVVDPVLACQHILDAAQSLQRRGVKPAMVILDCALTSDGVHPLSAALYLSILEACRQLNIVFVADEVQAGFCRSGQHIWGFQSLLSQHSSDLLPDIVTFGKPMGNGFPMGCVVTREEIANNFAKTTKYFNTFGGNPVAASACLAVLQVLGEEQLLFNAQEQGKALLQQMKNLQERYEELIVTVRGFGLLIGVEMASAALASTVVNRFRDQGVLISTCGLKDHVLKIRPPLCFPSDGVAQLSHTFNQILLDLSTH